MNYSVSNHEVDCPVTEYLANCLEADYLVVGYHAFGYHYVDHDYRVMVISLGDYLEAVNHFFGGGLVINWSSTVYVSLMVCD